MIRIVLLFFMFFCIVIHGSSSSQSQSQSQKITNQNEIIFDTNNTQNISSILPISSKAGAQTFTQAVYGKTCEEKFCTPMLKKRLKYLEKNDRVTYNRVINELSQNNQAIALRSKQRMNNINKRFDANALDEFISPEMIKQLIKAWKNSHQQQEQQIQDHVIAINDHQETIETHEGTIATQSNNLQTTRYKLYGAAFAAVLQLVGLIVMTLITN